MMLAVSIRRFSVLIEPVVICITGLIVGYVYIAFFTAVFSMANAG
jgi:type II secretory pathway component PulF